MKKIFVCVISALTLMFSSCSENETLMEEINVNQLKAEYSENDVLSFESQKAFDEAVMQISALSSDEEKSEWVKRNFPTFTSIQDLYWNAMDEMAEIDGDDKENISSFKKKYSKLYFPNFMEDAGFYIPISNLDAAFFANEDCKVSIAGKIVDLKDIFNYRQLMNLNRAYYSEEKTSTRAEMGSFQLNSTSMNSVGPEYDSGWKEYGKKKIKLKARRRFETVQVAPNFNGSKSLLHLEFCFRKKTWLGWSNYKSRSTINFEANVTGLGKITRMFENNGNSSHDDELEYPIKISKGSNQTFYTFYEAPCTAKVLFMDLGQEVEYKWNMAGIQYVSPRVDNPAMIIPSY